MKWQQLVKPQSVVIATIDQKRHFYAARLERGAVDLFYNGKMMENFPNFSQAVAFAETDRLRREDKR